jgi:hypothetical protein
MDWLTIAYHYIWWSGKIRRGCMYPFHICKIAKMHVLSETVERP